MSKEYYGVSDWVKIKDEKWKFSPTLNQYLGFNKYGHPFLSDESGKLKKVKDRNDQLDFIESVYGRTNHFKGDVDLEKTSKNTINHFYETTFEKETKELDPLPKFHFPENLPPIYKVEFLTNPNWKEMNFQEWLSDHHPSIYKDLYQ